MRLKIKKNTNYKKVSRLKKKIRVRKKIDGSTERPRLSIFRSAKHIYAQVIDDTTGQTMVAASSVKEKLDKSGNREAARQVGIALAKAALAKNITNVVFDRNGLLYHGRVKSFADGAREGGLQF